MTAPATTSATAPTVATSIRLPGAIHERVAKQAEHNLRSFNAELIAIVTGRSDVITTER